MKKIANINFIEFFEIIFKKCNKFIKKQLKIIQNTKNLTKQINSLKIFPLNRFCIINEIKI